MQAGETIQFGDHSWQVLETAGDRAFLVSKNIVGTGSFHKEHSDVAWESCSLRKWLNGKFLKSFSPADRARIVKTRIRNTNSPKFNTSGNGYTDDFVFLLSYDEVARFFKTNEERVATYNGAVYWWWLRTSGYTNQRAVKIKDLGGAGIYANGYIDTPGERVTLEGGIRPALWIKK